MPYLSDWDVKALFNQSTIYIAVQTGLQTEHITTFAITTACRKATHSANLQVSASGWDANHPTPEFLKSSTPG